MRFYARRLATYLSILSLLLLLLIAAACLALPLLGMVKAIAVSMV